MGCIALAILVGSHRHSHVTSHGKYFIPMGLPTRSRGKWKSHPMDSMGFPLGLPMGPPMGCIALPTGSHGNSHGIDCSSHGSSPWASHGMHWISFLWDSPLDPVGSGNHVPWDSMGFLLGLPMGPPMGCIALPKRSHGNSHGISCFSHGSSPWASHGMHWASLGTSDGMHCTFHELASHGVHPMSNLVLWYCPARRFFAFPSSSCPPPPSLVI